MLHDFKLRVFAFRDDIFAIHFPVSHQLGHVLHHGVVGADGVSRNYVNVGQFASHRDGLAAGDQGCFFNFLFLLFDYCGHCHDGLS